MQNSDDNRPMASDIRAAGYCGDGDWMKRDPVEVGLRMHENYFAPAIDGRLTHQPKGSMCLACEHALNDCSGMDFEAMAPIERVDGVVIVRCDFFSRPVRITS